MKLCALSNNAASETHRSHVPTPPSQISYSFHASSLLRGKSHHPMRNSATFFPVCVSFIICHRCGSFEKEAQLCECEERRASLTLTSFYTFVKFQILSTINYRLSTITRSWSYQQLVDNQKLLVDSLSIWVLLIVEQLLINSVPYITNSHVTRTCSIHLGSNHFGKQVPK
jgi:hypothetical protein